MYSSLLAAFLFLAPVSQDFDALRLDVLGPPKPSVTQGPVKAWEGALTEQVAGKDETVALYAVEVTDFKTLPQKPTEDQVLLLHERKVRSSKTLGGKNLRRTEAKIGSHKLLVLSGSGIGRNAKGEPTNAFLVSFAFVADDKAYEFTQISMVETEYRACYPRLAAMTLAEEGKRVRVTGAPTNAKGDYTLGGVPFVLTTAITPKLAGATAQDPLFGAQYTAVLNTTLTAPSHTYMVRQVKPDEKRTDAEIFRDLVNALITLKDTPAEKFAVKDGTATLELDFEVLGLPSVAHLRFEREGQWVAVLVSTAFKTELQGLRDVELRRLKP